MAGWKDGGLNEGLEGKVAVESCSVTGPALTRSLRLPHATALVVGTILGSAVFVQASELTEHVPRIWAVLLAWTVSGVLTLFGALACAELSSAFPRTGGVYV